MRVGKDPRMRVNRGSYEGKKRGNIFHVRDPFLSNGVVNGDQFSTIWKGGFDLDFGDHLGNPLHTVIARDNSRAVLHHIRYTAAITCALDDGITNKGYGL